MTSQISMVPIAVLLLAGAILLFAGLSKLANPSAIASTVRELGVDPEHARVVGALVAFCEIACAVLLVTVRGPGTALLVSGLALLFAAAGLSARWRDIHVACNCLGPAGRTSRLGLRQVALLPAWLLVAAAAWSNGRPTPTGGALGLAGVSAVTAIAALRPLIPAARRNRAATKALGSV